jgi:hypothetical protein
MSCASSGHITKLKQSIFAFRYLWEEQSPRNPEMEGSIPATATVGNKMVKILKLYFSTLRPIK